MSAGSSSTTHTDLSKKDDRGGKAGSITLHFMYQMHMITFLGLEWSIPHGPVAQDKASPATWGASGLDEHGPAHHAKGNL